MEHRQEAFEILDLRQFASVQAQSGNDIPVLAFWKGGTNLIPNNGKETAENDGQGPVYHVGFPP
jgi:hypothetical protein